MTLHPTGAQSGITDYDQLRAALKPGMFVTVRGFGLGGWAVRTGTRAKVAHAYIYLPGQPGGYDIVEAEPGGLRRAHMTEYPAEQSWPSLFKVSDEQSQGMATTADSLVGKPYGWVADVYIGMREALGIPIPAWLFKTKAVLSNMECSQAADFVAMANQVNYFTDHRAPGSVSPADLWRLDYAG